MFEQAFKNIDDVLRKEAGCTTELDYTEQTSWLLFLKYLDALDQDKAEIRWPNGALETLRNLPADAIYTIVEGQGIKATIKLPPPASR